MIKTFIRLGATVTGLAMLAGGAMAAPAWTGSYDPVPEGSYQRSCRDITAFNGRLYARCQSGSGGFYDSEIGYLSCPGGRVENVNGRLQCEGGGYSGGAGGWTGGGSGPVGLIVFENPDYKGQRLEIRDSVPDLAGSGLDDLITSVRVLNGSWLLCSARDFRGDCQTLSADSPNLKPIGLNDRVTSIRRLRR